MEVSTRSGLQLTPIDKHHLKEKLNQDLDLIQEGFVIAMYACFK